MKTALSHIVLIVALLLGQNLRAQTNAEEERIAGLLATLEENNRLVDELNAESQAEFPIGIQRTISNTRVVIAVDSLRITANGSYVSAYTQVTLPGTTKKITLVGRNIKLPTGNSASEPYRLGLITNISIPFSDHVDLNLAQDSRNYLEWDCSGFRSINLAGEFLFSSDQFIPDPELSNNANAVTAKFEIHTSDLNNILIGTSITPFKVKGLGNVSFAVENAWVDMSDQANCQGFVLPVGYDQAFAAYPDLWRGFFFKDLTVYLPKELGGTNERPKVNAHNMLIDESGFSGYLTASNLVAIEQSGSAWPISINEFSLGFTQNRITAGGLGGALSIPFLGGDTLGYRAKIESGPNGDWNYLLSINTNTAKDYTLPFGGTLRLDKACTYGMQIKQQKFEPWAILHGTLFLDNELIQAKGIRFEQLHLTAAAPYIQGGKFACAAEMGVNLAGFGCSVEDIMLGIVSGKAELAFRARVALMNEDEKGISGDTRFVARASMQESPSQKWKFDGVSVNDINIDAQLSLFKFNGKIGVYNGDQVYGKGFHGAVNLTIDGILNKPAGIEIYFGKKDNFKYWFTKIAIPTKIPIGPITLDQLTGGAYNRMTKKNLMSFDNDYIPAADAGMGFMAGVGVSVGSDKLLFVDALFEIAFNKDNGVRYIRFSGDGQFFTGSANSNKAAVRAKMVLAFDRQNDIFQANMGVYMNIAGIIKGVNADGLMGEAVVYRDPQTWYIHIGRPVTPIGVDVIGLFKAESYFMAGQKIDDFPLLPSEVRSLVNDMPVQRSEKIATGKGVAFGMHFKTTFGVGQNGGFVYAYLKAMAGTDITMQSWDNAVCAENPGVPFGINGWYAKGQAYAYLEGKIGIRVKKKEFDIMSVAAAMVLRAELPNPVWIKGDIAAKYKILGGLVKGKVNVSVELGKKCTIVDYGNELGDIKIIGDMQPLDGSKDVDVFVNPQVAFNAAIDTEFGMMNMSDEYNVYRVKLDEFHLKSGNQTITGDIEWNNNKDVAILKTLNIMPSEQSLKVAVKVHIEKKTTTGWEQLKAGGNPDFETSQVSFISGAEPKTIPENNIRYSYPVKAQYNFHKNEYNKGYIRLNAGQPNLFKTTIDGEQWKYIAKFETSSGQVIESPLTYDDSQATLNFDIPSALKNGSGYDMSIIRKPFNQNSTIDYNVKREEIAQQRPNTDDSLSIVQNTLTGAIRTDSEAVLHSYSFRTSIYNTFNDRLNAMSGYQDRFGIDTTLINRLGAKFSMQEVFDDCERNGRDATKPLVYAEGIMENSWLKGHVYPMVYELYGSDPGIVINNRANDLGIIPLKAMLLTNMKMEDYSFQGDQTANVPGEVQIYYNLPPQMYLDFVNLRNQAANRYIGKSIPASAQARRLIDGEFHNISRDTYRYRLNYRLPGIDKITTSRELAIVH